jgi:hypothetical protein
MMRGEKDKKGRSTSNSGRSLRVLALLYILIGIAVLACKKENANYTVRMTVLNAVPDADSFAIYAGGSQVSSFGIFGRPDDNLSVAAITDSIGWKIKSRAAFDSIFIADLPNGEDFTMLFYDSASRYKPYLVRDNWKQPASDRKGYYRFFPMIINANAITITNDTNKVLIPSRSFGDFAIGLSPFSEIDSFTTKLRLYNNNVLLDSMPNASILPGKSYTLYAVGVLNGTGDKRPRMILHRHE